jgi:hypothetical protein
MDQSWLRFSTNVTVHSARSVEDCVRSLRSLTALPNRFSHIERIKPFRGKIGLSGGWLRCPFRYYGIMPARSLRFDLVASESGTELRGQWNLLKGIRIPVAIYLGVCIFAQTTELFRLILLRTDDSLLWSIGPLISFAMIYGWTWGLVTFNRRFESQLIRAATYAMESDKSAKIVGELLSTPD